MKSEIILKLLTDYCPPHARVAARDEGMPALEAAAADVALLAAVGRVLEAGLKDLLRVSVWGQFEFEVFIKSERIDELVLLLVRLHWECNVVPV